MSAPTFLRSSRPDLSGWKAIAKVLRVSTRTAMRWSTRERDPLPVLFVNGRPVAYSADLRAWDTGGKVRSVAASASRLLRGWTEIARYLGVHRDSARRYARREGLPMRLRPDVTGRIVAWSSTAALDAWRLKRTEFECHIMPTVGWAENQVIFGTVAAEASHG